MRKILVSLSLLLLSNIVLASSYNVSLIFEEKGNLIFESNNNILEENEKALLWSIGKLNPDKNIELIDIDNKEEKVYLHISLDEYNNNTKNLEINFNYKKYLGEEEKIEEFETYNVQKIIELREQETVISELGKKQLKVVIKENK